MLTEISTDSTQLFAGARLSQTNPDCTACNRLLREGEPVTLYTAREEDAPAFTIERIYCRNCTPRELTSPTLGLSEHLFQSQLTRTLDVRTQREYQTLGTIQTLDASSPSQGTAEAHNEDPPTALLRDTHIQNPASAVYHIDDGEGQPLCNCNSDARSTHGIRGEYGPPVRELPDRPRGRAGNPALSPLQRSDRDERVASTRPGLYG
jgi:hypothetical protein